MTHYFDLARCKVLAPSWGRPRLSAVGWLSADHPYPKGAPLVELGRRLFNLIEAMLWDPMVMYGYHSCEFCRDPQIEMQDERGRSVMIGRTNLCVPMIDAEELFAAPSLIVHYVVHHGYQPPESFQDAVMRCPPTDSVEYMRSIEPCLPKSWREGDFFRHPLGQALAKRAGLMTLHDFHRLDERVDQVGGRRTYSPDQRPSQPPRWFDEEYLEPIRGLAVGFEARGEAGDARAVRSWIERLHWSACDMPTQRVSLDAP